jgi:DNA-binding transcriptional MerR regulator
MGMAEQSSGRPVAKSPEAFRTIAEVAADLDLPAHVLRFWESKFPQLRPLKRRGGRRYYRPEDIALLRRICSLLYTEGYTIKGVQRLLREGGGKGMSIASAPPAAAMRGEELAIAAEVEKGPSEERPHKSALHDVLTELEALRALLRASGC